MRVKTLMYINNLLEREVEVQKNNLKRLRTEQHELTTQLEDKYIIGLMWDKDRKKMTPEDQKRLEDADEACRGADRLFTEALEALSDFSEKEW